MLYLSRRPGALCSVQRIGARYEIHTNHGYCGFLEFCSSTSSTAEAHSEDQHWVLERMGIFKACVRSCTGDEKDSLSYTTSWDGNRGLLALPSGATLCCRYQHLGGRAKWAITQAGERAMVTIAMNGSERLLVRVFENPIERTELPLLLLASLYFALLHNKQNETRAALESYHSGSCGW